MKTRLVAFALLAFAMSAGQVNAGWHEFWQRSRTDYRRMNCWPQPFKDANRSLVRHNLSRFADRGWQLNNTLSNHMFDTATQQLTTAGMIKLRWIMTQAPLNRQQVFVLQGRTPEETKVRIKSVKRAVLQLRSADADSRVQLTNRTPWGGSGEYFQSVDTSYKQSIPKPRLPKRTGTTGGSLN